MSLEQGPIMAILIGTGGAAERFYGTPYIEFKRHFPVLEECVEE